MAVLVLATVLGSRKDDLPDAVSIERTPSTYRVTYEVRDADDVVTTEVLQVERPFRSLVVTRAGKPPGGEIVGGRASDLNRLRIYGNGRWTELQLPPALAASDLRLDGLLEDQARRGVQRVAGRACERYRLGGPVTGGTITPYERGGDRADVCVDADGLVLSEVWTQRGEVVRRRTAVDVAVGVDFDEGTFDVDDAEVIGAPEGGGSARPVTADSRFGDRTWSFPAVPDGFGQEGRWAVVWPRLGEAADPMAPQTAGRVAGMATVWTRGVDVLALEQGASADGSRPFPEHPNGERVELGALDLGEVVTDGRGTEVRVSYVDGSYVRVWSTLPRDRVLRLARSLVAGPGGTPTYVGS